MKTKALRLLREAPFFGAYLASASFEHWRAVWYDYQSRRRVVGRGYIIAGSAIVSVENGCQVCIGEGTFVGRYTVLVVAAYRAPGQPARPSRLVIGRRTEINEFNNLRAGSGDITIGDNCLISQYVSIIAANHGTAAGQLIRDQTIDQRRRDVHIGNDVWIGAGAVILPGIQVGDGAVVAAGGVVTRDVPAMSVVAGIPARVIGWREGIAP